MKTIFDYTNAILFSKDRSVFSNIEDETIFSPFMTNRWISMYSPEMATVVNVTTNKYWQIFKNKKEFFNFYVSIFPQLRRKKIIYIKKVKKETVKVSEKQKERQEEIALIAKNLQISTREVEEMQETLASLKV